MFKITTIKQAQKRMEKLELRLKRLAAEKEKAEKELNRLSWDYLVC